jgi:hypothetical protein
MRHAIYVVCAALLALTGCESTPEKQPVDPNAGPRAVISWDHEPVIETDFQHEWDEIDKNDRGVRDTEQVAMWVTERRNAVDLCLRAEPVPAVHQAVGLLEQILARVPDSSRDRFMLAQCTFAEAAHWYRLADGEAWEMNRLETERTAPREQGGGALTDEEVKAQIATIRVDFDLLLDELNKTASRSLTLFTTYRQVRPDDKRVYDYVWKLYFFLQNFPEALRWLDFVLAEMDSAGVPREEPLRQDYQMLRKEILDRMMDAQTTGGGFRPVQPLVRNRIMVPPTAPRGSDNEPGN